ICADIVGRTVFDRPIRGVPEIVSLSLVACVFLMLANAVYRQTLTRAEMLVGPLERRAAALADRWHVFLAAVGAALFALITIGSWPDFVRAVATREFAGVENLFKVPVWPMKLLLVVGSAVAAAELVRQLVLRVRAAAARRGER